MLTRETCWPGSVATRVFIYCLNPARSVCVNGWEVRSPPPLDDEKASHTILGRLGYRMGAVANHSTSQPYERAVVHWPRGTTRRGSCCDRRTEEGSKGDAIPPLLLTTYPDLYMSRFICMSATCGCGTTSDLRYGLRLHLPTLYMVTKPGTCLPPSPSRTITNQT